MNMTKFNSPQLYCVVNAELSGIDITKSKKIKQNLYAHLPLGTGENMFVCCWLIIFICFVIWVN